MCSIKYGMMLPEIEIMIIHEVIIILIEALIARIPKYVYRLFYQSTNARSV